MLKLRLRVNIRYGNWYCDPQVVALNKGRGCPKIENCRKVPLKGPYKSERPTESLKIVFCSLCAETMFADCSHIVVEQNDRG